MKLENTEGIKLLLTSRKEVTFYSFKYPDSSTKGQASQALGLMNFVKSRFDNGDYFSTFQKACETLKENR